ncbi:N-acetylmuramoyl-L-alanine amidase [Luteimonas sp. R10]|uniref:N-acetylmuramoyl-L-alanine amidase family protein n=1 Tax=Luteimonas sp. R10 TaxID=3108176 RepID=UPI00308D473F|nr:N-acetylmuramoyl-L-alanine amidase [Luteimonas sp. R10]
MATAPVRALYRRIADSVTSPRANTTRREVLLERPEDVLHVDAVEFAPEILDEDGEVVNGSTEPQAIPHKHPMVKIEPATNRIAHREVKIRVWSEGRPDGHHAGKTVRWSMIPMFVRPVEDGEEAGDPHFRGDWAQAAAGHRDRFEAPAEFTAVGFTRIDQEQASTTVDDTGHTAVRVNLPPIAFNAARLSVQLEGEDAAVDLIDLEVPGIIVIDPGHGGESDRPSSTANNATSHTSGILEKDLALDFGLRTRVALRALRVGEDQNLRIYLTRDDDTNVSGAGRANVGRDVGADVLLSIHFNGFNGIARGTETLVRRRSDNVNYDVDIALAQRVNDAVYSAILARDEGAIDRGIKERQLAALSDGELGNTEAHHPLRSALLEVEFIDNEAVDELLSINEGYEQVRQGIADAIANALVDDLRRNP